jgi:hypothetical protein
VTVVHEGQHIQDNNEMALTFDNSSELPDTISDPRAMHHYQTENNAFHTQSYYYEAIGKTDERWKTWNKGWAGVDENKQEIKRQKGIDNVLKESYGYSKENQGRSVVTLCSKGKCF